MLKQAVTSAIAWSIAIIFDYLLVPILYNAIEVCPLNEAHINSLDFAVGSRCSKIFCIKSRETISECMRLFNCQSIKDVADKRRQNVVKKYSCISKRSL